MLSSGLVVDNEIDGLLGVTGRLLNKEDLCAADNTIEGSNILVDRCGLLLEDDTTEAA